MSIARLMQQAAAGAGGGGWVDPDITTAVFEQSISIQGGGFYLQPDGSHFFYAENGSPDRIEKWSLTDPNDISTASFVASSTFFANPVGLDFKPDGTTMYYVNNTADDIFQIDLTTPWDISSGLTQVASLLNPSTIIRGIRFNSAGTELYLGDRPQAKIKQYTLSTAWDLSTATFTASSPTLSIITWPELFFVSPLGDSMWIIDNNSTTGVIYKYQMTTPEDITTLTYTGDSFSFGVESNNPRNGGFSVDRSKMYVPSSGNATLLQYAVS